MPQLTRGFIDEADLRKKAIGFTPAYGGTKSKR